MRVRFVYAAFQRHAEAHPELREWVPCNEYFGPPSLGIAYIAAVTPSQYEIEFRDDRIEDIGLDDDVDLVAISCFTPSAKRAMEIADAFRARGKKVVLGGIFPTAMPDVAKLHADAVVIGEGEAVWPTVLEDARLGQLKPVYESATPVDLEALPPPRVDLYLDKEGPTYRPDDYPVQVSRGCPLRCSACILPVSMGRTLRNLPDAHVLALVDALNARGKLASFTEDTSFFPTAGTLRRFVELCETLGQGSKSAKVSYIGISMPMILATPSSALARMQKAGITMFYLVGGFDPITRGAFTGTDPKSHSRAVEAIRKAFDHGIEPYTSFLVGNEDDDEGTFDRMLEFSDTAGVRKAEFAIMTPYPGTPVWQRLVNEKRILHRDWSKYNDANVVYQPAKMSPDALLAGYLYLWREFYKSRQALRSLDVVERTIQF